MGEEKPAVNDERSSESQAISEVVSSLDDSKTAGLILEEQAKSLKSILADPAIQHLIKAHGTLKQKKTEAVKIGNVDLLKEVATELKNNADSNGLAAELEKLLSNPHMTGLIESHDAIAAKSYEPTPPLASSGSSDANGLPAGGEPIRMVGLNKSPNESLGLTLKQRGGNIVVARIIKGSMIDKQGLLNVGDVIKEVNGQPVKNNPERVQKILKDSSTKVILKVAPCYVGKQYHSQVFMKTLFSFDPKSDDDIPCKEAGLSFQRGEILEILDQSDATWWQAKKVEGDGETGLIPSRTLEEKRRTFIHPRVTRRRSFLMCGSRKKKKTMYDIRKTAEFDKHEVASYEEVAKMPPFERKTLVLVGAEGVGRRTLKNKIAASDPERFATAIPHTSREKCEGEENGKGYHFVTREFMQEGCRTNMFLEYGEYNGNIYGTSLDTVRDVLKEHKMCVVDTNPASLKILNSSEFMPYIVFIASPTVDELEQRQKEAPPNSRKLTSEEMGKIVSQSEEIARGYSQHFDLTIVNKNMTETYERLMKALEGLSTGSQWVPVSWVY